MYPSCIRPRDAVRRSKNFSVAAASYGNVERDDVRLSGKYSLVKCNNWMSFRKLTSKTMRENLNQFLENVRVKTPVVAKVFDVGPVLRLELLF